MRRLKKSMVSLIFFHFGLTSMLVISCRGGETRTQNVVDFNKVKVFAEHLEDDGLIVKIIKIAGEIQAYALYGYDNSVGPSKYDLIFVPGITKQVPMRLCNPKPKTLSIGIYGLTDPQSRFDLTSDPPGPGVTITPIPCPFTTTTTIAPTTTTKSTTTTSTTTKANTNLAANSTLPTSTIITTTEDFGLEYKENETVEDDGDKFNARIRVIVAGLAFVSIICNNFCNDFLETY